MWMKSEYKLIKVIAVLQKLIVAVFYRSKKDITAVSRRVWDRISLKLRMYISIVAR